MNTAEREPMEQIDYGINYRSSGSSSNTIKIEGGLLAIAIALVAIGASITPWILLPHLMESSVNEAVAVQLRPISAQVASAQDRAWLAERDARVASDEMKILQVELAKRGIFVRTDGHAQE